MIARESKEVEGTIKHNEATCPLVEIHRDGHGLCWSVSFDDDSDTDLQASESLLLSDHDISSMLIGKELFFEGGRYKLKLECEIDPGSREGVVFRESKRIAQALGLRTVPQGCFLHLSSEQLTYELTKMEGGITNRVRSTLTGKVVSRGTFIVPEIEWDVDQSLTDFKEETDRFVESYFGKGTDTKKVIVDYKKMLRTMKEYLKALKKR